MLIGLCRASPARGPRYEAPAKKKNYLSPSLVQTGQACWAFWYFQKRTARWPAICTASLGLLPIPISLGPRRFLRRPGSLGFASCRLFLRRRFRSSHLQFLDPQIAGLPFPFLNQPWPRRGFCSPRNFRSPTTRGYSARPANSQRAG